MDFTECERLVASSRDKQSKPVANNTRVERRNEDTYALRLHATDIATFHRDGRIEINSGGWRTVTTKDRLGAVTRHVYSERGTWYVQAEPNDQDPEPVQGRRTVPKPFHALDPGPEPVKGSGFEQGLDGCVAGEVHAVPYEKETPITRSEIEMGAWRESDIIRPYDGSYFVGYVNKRGQDVTYYGEDAWGYHVSYREEIDKQFGSLSINDRAHYQQCPHCKLFDAQHHAWDEAMHGKRWGRSSRRGYSQMVANLERYGSREAWQDAYLADFRAAREARTAHKAWVERNRVLFDDGMEITAEGYAKRPDLKQVAREQRQLKRIERKKNRINKFVDDAMAALQAGMPMPGPGDCWGCFLRADDNIEPMGVDHLEQHIKERYYVPSMFINALRDAGYIDAGIGIFLMMDFDSNTMGGERIVGDNVRRALRKYLYKRLLDTQAVHA